MTSLHKEYFSIHPEIDQALREGKPIVALESTVITHGLPFPENEKLAKDLEDEVRKKGCIPATIAILDGMICIGLDEGKLARLAQTKGMLKVSSRDIAPAIAKHKSGGTTVAGTLAIAQAVGIRVFATGGIGGVHRGAPFDVSADLGQLGRSQLVVVCAGAKAILDIPATLEVLETNGVPVIGYKTDEFPAFYSLSSGIGGECTGRFCTRGGRLCQHSLEFGVSKLDPAGSSTTQGDCPRNRGGRISHPKCIGRSS